MIASLIATLFLGLYLGRFMTVYSIVPACCLVTTVEIGTRSGSLLMIVAQIVVLVAVLQVGYVAGLALTGHAEGEKSERARKSSTWSLRPVITARPVDDDVTEPSHEISVQMSRSYKER